jgi:hypothetical protein
MSAIVFAQETPVLLVATLIGPPVAWAPPCSPDIIYDAQNLELSDR